MSILEVACGVFLGCLMHDVAYFVWSAFIVSMTDEDDYEP